jgi:hypothetical protein
MCHDLCFCQIGKPGLQIPAFPLCAFNPAIGMAAESKHTDLICSLPDLAFARRARMKTKVKTVACNAFITVTHLYSTILILNFDLAPVALRCPGLFSVMILAHGDVVLNPNCNLGLPQ